MEISTINTPKLPVTSPSGETEGEPGADAIDSIAAADFQEMLQVLMQGAPNDDTAAVGIIPPDANVAASQSEEEHAATSSGMGALLPGAAFPPDLIPASAATGMHVMAPSVNSAIATDGISVTGAPPVPAAPISDAPADPRSARTLNAQNDAGNERFAGNADATGNLSAATASGLAAQQAENATGYRDPGVTALSLPMTASVFRGADHAAASPASQPRLESPVGTAGWSGEFAQKVMWIAGDRQQSAELHLNPPELGPLSIRLAIEDDQASAVFHSAHSEVREAIQAALPRLREVLAESGIALGNASVTADSPREGSAFERKQQPQSSASGSAAGVGAEDPAAVQHPRSNGGGLVNLFA